MVGKEKKGEDLKRIFGWDGENSFCFSFFLSPLEGKAKEREKGKREWLWGRGTLHPASFLFLSAFWGAEEIKYSLTKRQGSRWFS